MDDFYEAIEPEPTFEEIEADCIDHLLQTGPPIVWECYRQRDNECHIGGDESNHPRIGDVVLVPDPRLLTKRL